MPDSERQKRQFSDALKALKSLEEAGYAARLAGGCVRDRMLGLAPVDFDIATEARPEAVMAHFRRTSSLGRSLKVVPTGIAHGTVTLVMPSGPIEITTLRLDVATDGRHAEVRFGESFAEDAARRDFTINAMFEDREGRVYDFFGGVTDLKAGKLRFVGAAPQRIREDYLRILRLFRFWARFGYPPVEGTLAAVHAERAGLAQISQERITGELLRLCAGAYALAPLAAMQETAVLPLVLPEVTPLRLAAPQQILAWQRVPAAHRGLVVFGGLCLHSAKSGGAQVTETTLQALGTRLRLSSHDIRRLVFLGSAETQLRLPSFPDAASCLGFVDEGEACYGRDALAQVIAPIFAANPATSPALLQVQTAEDKFGHLRGVKLPLDGLAVAAALGIGAGPALGAALAELKAAFRNGEWTTKAEGLAWLKALNSPKSGINSRQ